MLGENSAGTCVAGSGKTGVHGSATSGTCVNGTFSTGTGVHGTAHPGVQGNGSGGNSVGVAGSATLSGGGGGVFAGDVAQPKLTPGSKSSHPSSGQRGDLYADPEGRLWFCKGGTSWHQLA